MDDDIGSEYGSEFSDSSDGSSMFSSDMASEVPEGWEWSEEHQDYIYAGEENMNMEGEEGGIKGELSRLCGRKMFRVLKKG